MWCPNCKNEYVPGITRCADCNIPLVESLDTAGDPASSGYEFCFDQDSTSVESSRPGEVSGLAQDPGQEESAAPDDAASPVTAAHAYISQRTRSEDMKSTAYTFTLIGGAGLIILALFIAGVLPIQTASYMKVMICIVMGGMFSIFLLVGIHAFRQLKRLGDAADTEDALYSEIMAWFTDTCTAGSIDAQHDGAADEEELLYFARYRVMQQRIAERYPDLEESFQDHVIESLYAKLF